MVPVLGLSIGEELIPKKGQAARPISARHMHKREIEAYEKENPNL
jgi:uncharacterized DUF497 family protein